MSNLIPFVGARSHRAQRSGGLALMIFVFMFVFGAVKNASPVDNPAPHFSQAAAISIYTPASSLFCFPQYRYRGRPENGKNFLVRLR